MIGNAVNDQLVKFALLATETFGKLMASFGTFWIYMPTGDIAESISGGSGNGLGFLNSALFYFVAFGAVVSLVIVGIKMMITQRGHHLVSAFRGLVTLALVTTAALPTLALLISAGDEFSVWIVNLSTEGPNFGIAMALTALLAPGGPFLVILLAFVAIIVSLLQAAMMLIRIAMLIVLGGMLPVVASTTATEGGKAAFAKHVSWLFALVLYKPVAAIIYATAFSLINRGVLKFGGRLDEVGLGVMNVLIGLILMILAIVAWGALMKFVLPTVGALGGGGAGAAAGMGAVASGAISVMALKGFGGGAGSKGATGSASPGGDSANSGPRSASGSGSGMGSAAGVGSGMPRSGGATSTGAHAGTGGVSAGTASGSVAAGASAGAAGGPIGAGVGAAAGAAVDAGQRISGAINATTSSALEEGPHGSR